LSNIKHVLKGSSIYFVYELDKKINEVGDNLAFTVSKNTFVVIVKDLTKITANVEKDKEKRHQNI